MEVDVELQEFGVVVQYFAEEGDAVYFEYRVRVVDGSVVERAGELPVGAFDVDEEVFLEEVLEF